MSANIRPCYRDHSGNFPCPNIWCEHGLFERPGVPALEMHRSYDAPTNVATLPTGEPAPGPVDTTVVAEPGATDVTTATKRITERYLRVHRWDSSTGAEWWIWVRITPAGEAVVN